MSPSISTKAKKACYSSQRKATSIEVDQQNLDLTIAKEYLEEHEHQGAYSSVINEEIQIEGSRVDAKGKLGKLVINQLYNTKFFKKL